MENRRFSTKLRIEGEVQNTTPPEHDKVNFTLAEKQLVPVPCHDFKAIVPVCSLELPTPIETNPKEVPIANNQKVVPPQTEPQDKIVPTPRDASEEAETVSDAIGDLLLELEESKQKLADMNISNTQLHTQIKMLEVGRPFYLDPDFNILSLSKYIAFDIHLHCISVRNIEMAYITRRSGACIRGTISRRRKIISQIWLFTTFYSIFTIPGDGSKCEFLFPNYIIFEMVILRFFTRF